MAWLVAGVDGGSLLTFRLAMFLRDRDRGRSELARGGGRGCGRGGEERGVGGAALFIPASPLCHSWAAGIDGNDNPDDSDGGGAASSRLGALGNGGEGGGVYVQLEERAPTARPPPRPPPHIAKGGCARGGDGT